MDTTSLIPKLKRLGAILPNLANDPADQPTQQTDIPEDENTLRGGVNFARSQFETPQPVALEGDSILGPMTLRNQPPSTPQAQQVAPQIQPKSEFEEEQERYYNTTKAPSNKQGIGAQIAFQAFRGLENLGRAMQGQDLNPLVFLGDAKKAMRDQRAAQRFAPFVEQRKREIDEQGKLIDNQKKFYDAQKSAADSAKSMLSAIQQKNPEFTKVLEKQGYVTEEQSKWAEENGYGKIPVSDWREKEYQEREGITYERPKGSNEVWKKSTIPDNKSKYEMLRQLPDGTPYYTTGDKEADRIATAAYRQAQLDLQAGRITSQEMAQYDVDMRKWTESENKRNLDNESLLQEAASKRVSASSREAEALKKESEASRIEEDEPEASIRLRQEASKLRQESTDLQGEANVLDSKVKNSKPNARPKVPSRTEANTLPSTEPKKMTSSEREQIINRKVKDGMTREAASQWFEKMRQSEGYTVENE